MSNYIIALLIIVGIAIVLKELGDIKKIFKHQNEARNINENKIKKKKCTVNQYGTCGVLEDSSCCYECEYYN